MLHACICIADVGVNTPDKIQKVFESGDIASFIKTASINSWKCPRIPSKWSVEAHHKIGATRDELIRNRKFGFIVAVTLEGIAETQQTLPVNEVLWTQSLLLCDLADWCTTTQAYGNMLLGRRCLELAAVGLARLSAEMNFPLSKIEALVARMNTNLFNSDYCIAVINNEAECELLPAYRMFSDDEMSAIWAAGWTMRENMLGRTPPPADPVAEQLINKNEFNVNMDIFNPLRFPASPNTLVRLWEAPPHKRFFVGLQNTCILEAKALFLFRKTVGFFPIKYEFDGIEVAQRQYIIEHPELGLEIWEPPQNPKFEERRMYFRKAWLNRVPKDDRTHVSAWVAFHKVHNGAFLDSDTAEIYNEKTRLNQLNKEKNTQ